jgi:hypothetical protein
MPLAIQCPACQKKLNVPDKLLGKRVKCPSCSEAFVAAEAPTESAKPKPKPPPKEAITDTPKKPPKPKYEEVDDDLVETEPEYVDEPEEKPRRSRRRSRDDDDDDDDDRVSTRKRRRRDEDDDDNDDDYDDRPRRRRRVHPHRGGLILTLGIIGLCVSCCPLAGWILGGIAANMAKTDLAAMSSGRMDKSGYGMTMAGNICAIVAIVLAFISFIANIILRISGVGWP